MSFTLFVLAAAGTIVDCEKVQGAVAQDQCYLSQSLAADPPFDCINRKTQSDMNVCSFRDYLRSDIELNQVWGQVTASRRGSSPPSRINPKSEFGMLRDAQRAWLIYREKHCDGLGKRYDGGTIQSLVIGSCLSEITKLRISELKYLLDDN